MSRPPLEQISDEVLIADKVITHPCRKAKLSRTTFERSQVDGVGIILHNFSLMYGQEEML